MDTSKDNRIDELEDVSLSICRIKTRRLKVAAKVNQRKSKSVRCFCRLKYYNRASLSTTTTSNEYDHQDFIPSIPCHAIFVFLDPILLGVLQVEFQNKKESPFDTHTVHKQTFLTAICIYSALLGIQIHTHTRGGGGGYLQAQILSYALLFSGTLSSASLLSITLQQRLLWVVLFVWGSIPLILARHLLKSLVLILVAKLNRGVRNCMLAIMVLIFHNKDSSSSGSNNTTYLTDPLEGKTS